MTEAFQKQIEQEARQAVTELLAEAVELAHANTRRRSG